MGNLQSLEWRLRSYFRQFYTYYHMLCEKWQQFASFTIDFFHISPDGAVELLSGIPVGRVVDLCESSR